MKYNASTMKVVDLTKAVKGKTGWISISPDYKAVVAHAKTLKGLVYKLKKKGNPDGYITYAPPGKFSSYVG